MNDSTVAVTITQADVDVLLVRLQGLREQIAAAREALAPLEANLVLAYDQFQAVVGLLRRQALHLQAEIATLRARIDESEGAGGKNAFMTADNGGNRPGVPTTDPEAVEKDHLLEYIFRVLDPMVSDEDAELVATLQGLCKPSDPVSRANWRTNSFP